MADMPDHEVFKLVAYMVSSAALIPEETFALASFRLLDAARRLIEAHDAAGNEHRDAFLAEILQQCRAHFNEVMVDEDRFLAWTRQLCAQVTSEARVRNIELANASATTPEGRFEGQNDA
jgi:hypothetical protein